MKLINMTELKKQDEKIQENALQWYVGEYLNNIL